MSDPQELFERQANWQKSLRELPWAEKLRMAARLRDSVVKLRDTRQADSRVRETARRTP